MDGTITLSALRAVATEDMVMETQAAEATMEVLEVTMEITMEGAQGAGSVKARRQSQERGVDVTGYTTTSVVCAEW